jgi:hypothetical protein
MGFLEDFEKVFLSRKTVNFKGVSKFSGVQKGFTEPVCKCMVAERIRVYQLHEKILVVE